MLDFIEKVLMYTVAMLILYILALFLAVTFCKAFNFTYTPEKARFFFFVILTIRLFKSKSKNE